MRFLKNRSLAIAALLAVAGSAAANNYSWRGYDGSFWMTEAMWPVASPYTLTDSSSSADYRTFFNHESGQLSSTVTLGDYQNNPYFYIEKDYPGVSGNTINGMVVWDGGYKTQINFDFLSNIVGGTGNPGALNVSETMKVNSFFADTTANFLSPVVNVAGVTSMLAYEPHTATMALSGAQVGSTGWTTNGFTINGSGTHNLQITNGASFKSTSDFRTTSQGKLNLLVDGASSFEATEMHLSNLKDSAMTFDNGSTGTIAGAISIDNGNIKPFDFLIDHASTVTAKSLFTDGYESLALKVDHGSTLNLTGDSYALYLNTFASDVSVKIANGSTLNIASPYGLAYLHSSAGSHLSLDVTGTGSTFNGGVIATADTAAVVDLHAGDGSNVAYTTPGIQAVAFDDSAVHFTVDSGATVSTSTIMLAAGTNAESTLDISTGGSVSASVHASNATVFVHDGGTLQGFVEVGGGRGKLEVGNGGIVNTFGVQVGLGLNDYGFPHGAGTLTATDGATIRTDELFIGTDPLSTGSKATLQGASSTYSASRVSVGGYKFNTTPGDAATPGAPSSLWVTEGAHLVLGTHYDEFGTLQTAYRPTLAVFNGSDVQIDPTSSISIGNPTDPAPALPGTVSVYSGGFLFGRGLIHSGLGKAEISNVGGSVEPGLSPGILSIDGNYTQTAGDLTLEIGGLAAGTEYDQLDVTGDISILGGTIRIIPYNGYTLTGNADFQFFTGFSHLTIAPTVTFVLEGGMSLNGFDPNTGRFSITPVPEPASFAPLSLGLVLLLKRRKR